MTAPIYSVSQLQAEVRDLLESGYRSIWVEGEVSGHRKYPSGHHYFTLKDENSQLSAVVWRSAERRLVTLPENGLLVRARGTLTVYPARGNYAGFASYESGGQSVERHGLRACLAVGGREFFTGARR